MSCLLVDLRLEIFILSRKDFMLVDIALAFEVGSILFG